MTNNDNLALKAESIIADMKRRHKDIQIYAPIMTWAEFEVLLAEGDADKKVIADSVVLFETLRQRIAELEALTAEQDQRLITYAAIAAKNASEARTVSVKVPYLPPDCDRTEAHFKYQAAIAAAGINLEVGE